MIRFVDLFAGIGGIRLAFEAAGCENVFSSEWDKFAQKTYSTNFGDTPGGDIRNIKSEEIPSHNILLAGFPCQPFSISGVSKKNSLGEKHGFEDKKHGNLFFEIERILKDKKPEAFMLENVKHLKRHDKGNTFKVIRNILEKKLKYKIYTKVVDGQHYTPQHRERIFIVGFCREFYRDINFEFPEPPSVRQLELTDILQDNVEEKYTLSDHLWNYLQEYKKKHQKKGNGFGFGLVDPAENPVTRTLSARYYKDGSEILIKQRGKNPRRLTPRECARLMGFSDDFEIPVSDTQAYKQFGNSVVVPVVCDIAKVMVQTIQQRYLKASVKYQVVIHKPDRKPEKDLVSPPLE